jgi:cell division protein FtsW
MGAEFIDTLEAWGGGRRPERHVPNERGRKSRHKRSREGRTRPLRAKAARVSRGQLEQRLLVLVTLGLVAFGLVMVYSATSAAAAVGGGNPSGFLQRQGIYALVGIALLIGAARFDYHGLRLLAPGLVIAAFALCCAVLVVAPEINGAKRWLQFGPATFQPSELAKVALCVWIAAHLARRPAPRSLGELAKPVGLLTAVFCGLLMLQPDLGTTITLCVMLLGVLVVTGTPARVIVSACALAAALGFAAIWIEPYRRARVFSFLDPWQDAEGAGFQSVQAIIGFGSGGLTGEGLGEGVQKVNYLPEAHTDMIFAIIGEELGLLGSALVISAFAVFAYAGFRTALRCRDPFGKRLAAGITALICGQAAVNLAAVLGLAPLTGIPLPFVSYGGSSLICLLAAVGILHNIAGNGRVVGQRSRVPDRRRGDGGARAAGTRGSGGTARARRDRELRRVAGSRRG